MTMDVLASFLFKEAMILTVITFFISWVLLMKRMSKRRAMLFWSVAVVANAAWWLLSSDSEALVSIARPAAVIWGIMVLVAVIIGLPLILTKGLFFLIRRACFQFENKEKTVASGRRRFLTSGVLFATSAGISTTGTLQSMSPFEVHHEEVSISGLPKELDGFRIGHMTDVHVGNFIDPQDLAAAVQALNKEKVDLQVMTGDLIDNVKHIKQTFDALEQCDAQHGMVAILGNHEKWLCLNEVLEEYQQRSRRGVLRLLNDESSLLRHRGVSLRIVGVEYPMEQGGSHSLPLAQREDYMKKSAKKAFAEVQKEEMIICLSHHPDFFSFSAANGAKLTLAGHTHGGQVALFGRSLLSNFEHMLGWYQKGDAHLYVSGGLGHWLPFRIGVPASVAVITLRTQKNV